MNIKKTEKNDAAVPSRCLYTACSVDLIGINADLGLRAEINGRFLSRPDARRGSAGEGCAERRRVGFNPCRRLCSTLLFVPSGRILIHAQLLRDAPREHRPRDLPRSQLSSPSLALLAASHTAPAIPSHFL